MFQQCSPLSSAKNQGPAVVGGVWVPRGVSGLSLQTQSSDCKAEVFFLLVSASWRDWSRGWCRPPGKRGQCPPLSGWSRVFSLVGKAMSRGMSKGGCRLGKSLGSLAADG